MKIYANKETVPVIYNKNALKLLYFKKNGKDMCFWNHWHSRMELLRILEGEMILNLGNKEIVAKKDEMVIIPPEVSHKAVSGETGVEYEVIMFDISLLCNGTYASTAFLNPILKGETVFDSKTDIKEIINLADILFKTREKDDFHSVCVIGKIYELIGLILSHCSKKNNFAESSKNFQTIIDYIDNNFSNKDLTTITLSKIFNYDEAYFCRCFKEQTGISVMNYIKMLRLELSQNLLKNTDEQIKHIAHKCGFCDSSYFIYLFKKNYNFTPMKYRKESRKTLQ